MKPEQAAAIQAGGQVLSTGINAMAQSNLNRKQRKWNEKMYDRQRADSLADWNSLNSYNHPTAQMQRLAEAGLNPNLVYGNGADAQASQAPRSSDTGSWNPRAPQVDLNPGGALNAYFDASIKQAQTDNLRAQNDVLMQDKFLRQAQVEQTLTNTEDTAFNLGLKQDLRQNSLDAAQAGLQKTLADTKYTLDNNERQAAANTQSIQEAMERILTMRLERTKVPLERQEIQARIRNLDKDEKLKQLDINLRENGINPNDPMWMRILGQTLNDVGESSTWKWMKNYKGFLSPKGRQQLKDLFK